MTVANNLELLFAQENRQGSWIHCVERRSSHDGTSLLATCLFRGTQMRRNIVIHARCDARVCVHNKDITVLQTYELVRNLDYFGIFHAYTSRFREEGDDRSNCGLANTGV